MQSSTLSTAFSPRTNATLRKGESFRTMKSHIHTLMMNLSPVYRKLYRLEETIRDIERYSRYNYLRHYCTPKTIHVQSQYGQDIFVESVLGGKRKGTFLEVGALDGITASNTYYLEKALGWTGILIEANPQYYALLAKNRSQCQCVQSCISDTSETVEFVDHGGLSGIKGQLSVQHTESTGNAPVIRLPTEPLQAVLDKLQTHHLDYLSVDTEGSELSVLKSVDYSHTDITLIGVEVNYRDYDRSFKPLSDFLQRKGYRYLERIGVDCFFHKYPNI
jgi:FkbM family methyltransferase